MSKDNISVEISNDSVRSIIEAHVQTAVMEALLPHKEEFVRELVERSLLAKSKHEDYHYINKKVKPTVLEHMVRTIIADEARKGIEAWAESHREEIAANIQKAMSSKKFGRTMAMNIAQQMAECNEYKFRLEVTTLKSDG